MASWLNYHHLLYFREIATQGSIAAAAQSLNLSPSALSMQLKNLEETLGHPVLKGVLRSSFSPTLVAIPWNMQREFIAWVMN
jgi:DNA-binding transcriptional LysR family regulator